MKTRCIVTLVSLSWLMTACMNTGQVFQRQNFTSYLDGFVGKPKEEVSRTLNLQQFGFEAVTQSKSLQTDQQMVYSIIRPLSIPIPMPTHANPSMGMGMGGGSGTIGSGVNGANSYELKATCNITFHLENNVVSKWDAKGKAC